MARLLGETLAGMSEVTFEGVGDTLNVEMRSGLRSEAVNSGAWRTRRVYEVNERYIMWLCEPCR